MHRLRRHTLALALLAGVLAFGHPGAAQASARWMGINDLSSVSGAVPFATSATLAAEAGVNSTRLIVDWSWIEPVRGVYLWGIVDGVYAADLARGIRPLIGVTGAPRWAWAPGASCPATSTCPYPPGSAHDADYSAMMGALARRYPRAAGIEVGNEPNLRWAWAGGLSAARYTALVKNAYAAVKAVNRAMPVIAGALAPVLNESTTAGSIGMRPFLRAMYANGLKGHADGISIHPYPWGVNFALSFKALSLAREVEAVNGDSTPLWATEIGMTTTGPQAFTAAQQATTLPALVGALRADPAIQGVYVHTLRDNPANPIPSERGYGLLGGSLTPKPVFCRLAVVNASSWRCPSPAVVPSAMQVNRWRAQTLLQAAAEAAIRAHTKLGAYRRLTPKMLHAIDPRISRLPAGPAQAPGKAADPHRIGVFPGSGSDWLTLCNASRADVSYCISTVWGGNWAYGKAAGPISAAAGATIHRTSGAW